MGSVFFPSNLTGSLFCLASSFYHGACKFPCCRCNAQQPSAVVAPIHFFYSSSAFFTRASFASSAAIPRPSLWVHIPCPAAFVDTLPPVLVPLSSIPNPPVSAFPRTFPYCFSLDRGLPCLLALIATASAQLRFAFLTGLNCKLRLSPCWRSIGDFSLIFR